jgi:hypothetical protein
MRVKLRLKMTAAVLAALLCGALAASPAMAEFGIEDFDVAFNNQDPLPGPTTAVTQAGAHPFAVTAKFNMNKVQDGPLEFPDEEAKELTFELPAGFVGKPGSVPQCATADFLRQKSFGPAGRRSASSRCALDSAARLVT